MRSIPASKIRPLFDWLDDKFAVLIVNECGHLATALVRSLLDDFREQNTNRSRAGLLYIFVSLLFRGSLAVKRQYSTKKVYNSSMSDSPIFIFFFYFIFKLFAVPFLWTDLCKVLKHQTFNQSQMFKHFTFFNDCLLRVLIFQQFCDNN